MRCPAGPCPCAPFSSQGPGCSHTSTYASFSVASHALGWHRSPDSARAFLVLRVASSAADDGKQNPELGRLLALCNGLVAQAGQPELYAGAPDRGDGAFHVSLAWSLARDVDEMERRTAAVAPDMATVQLRVASVKVKIGNVVTNIPLAAETRSARASLFGL